MRALVCVGVCGLAAGAWAGPKTAGGERRVRAVPAVPEPASPPMVEDAAVEAVATQALPPAPRGVGLGFTEVSASTGLVHTHQTMPTLTILARNNAAGGAAGDFDGDGFDDLFVLGGGANPDRMFRNNGDGTFTDVAGAWGLSRQHHAFGASSADFDGDGDLDLYVTSFGVNTGAAVTGKHMLLRNDALPGGSRAFVDIGVSAGVNSLWPNLVDGTGSGWGDYDLDGDLDLFVCSYRSQSPGNRLFRNDGPDQNGVWRFTDATVSAGLQFTGVQGFLPRFTDMTGDGSPELLLIADTGSAKYLVNDGDGTFTDRSVAARGLGTANAMGVDVGDINNDGMLDWYVTNIAYPDIGNVLLVQNADGSFDDRALSAGVQNGYWGWGTVITDLDHDGDNDIVETNGSSGSGWGGRPSLVFLNDGDGSSFTESAVALGLDHTGQGRGLIRMDLENDGDLDMVILCNNQAMAVFRNDLIGAGGKTPAGAHWLRVRLDTSNRATLAPRGIGSLVTVLTSAGERVAPVDNASNHCTTSPAEAHFGVGADMVLAARVTWADGTTTTRGGVAANQVLTIAAPAHPADFDASGTVNALDAGAYVDAFLAGDLACDTDGDWGLDFFDVARFLEQLRDGM